MSGIFHSGVLTPHAEWKISMLFFWVWNPFISTFGAFLGFTIIKVDGVAGGGGWGGGGGGGGVGEEVSRWFPLHHISVVPSFTRISAPIWSVSSRLRSPRNDVQHYLLVSGSAFWEVSLDGKKLNNDYTFILSCLPHYSAFSSVGACVNKVCSIIIRLARHTRPTRYSWTSYYCCTAVVHMLHWLRSHRQPNRTSHS